MGISFDAPLALFLLVPALLLTIGLHVGARRRLGSGRRRAALIVRALLLSALVFALAGFQLVLPVDRLATVFVVDLSDSVGNAGREDALAFLRETLKQRPDGDVAGIVAFGKGALVERLPSELTEIDRLASAPIRSATDIGAALRLASALFPDDAQKRIVLLSDGNDTTGDGQTEAALAASRGVQIETRRIGLGDVEEVLVERLTTPSTARLGEAVPVSVEVRSTVAQTATVRLFANGTPASTRSRSPTSSRSRPGSSASVQSSRPHSTRSARTIAPTRTRSSRASPEPWSSPATIRSRSSWSRRFATRASRSTPSSPRRSRPISPASPAPTVWSSLTSPGYV